MKKNSSLAPTCIWRHWGDSPIIWSKKEAVRLRGAWGEEHAAPPEEPCRQPLLGRELHGSDPF